MANFLVVHIMLKEGSKVYPKLQFSWSSQEQVQIRSTWAFFIHISLIRTQNHAPFFYGLLFIQGIFCQNFNFFLNQLDWLATDSTVCWASLYRALILVILKPKSYMARAHKLQINLGQYRGPILSLGLGSLQPTMNPYGFLVVKQGSKCGKSSTPRDCEECLWSQFLRLMGTLSRAEKGEKRKWKWEEQGFWYKKPEWKERRIFSFAFIFWEKLCLCLVRKQNKVWRRF